jgi:hypothetical protein
MAGYRHGLQNALDKVAWMHPEEVFECCLRRFALLQADKAPCGQRRQHSAQARRRFGVIGARIVLQTVRMRV